MKLEDQVCSLELAKKLKELGVKQESALVWSLDVVDGFCLVLREIQEPDIGPNDCAAFTVAELGGMLPGHIGMDWFLQFWKSDFSGPASFSINYKDPKTEGKPEIGWMLETIIEKKEADARAEMLIHLIEKGVIKP